MNSKPLLNPQEVCDYLGVSNYSLRRWRRLPFNHPLHLPAFADPSNKNIVWYLYEDLTSFIARNEVYRNRLLAKQAPPEFKKAFSPTRFDFLKENPSC